MKKLLIVLSCILLIFTGCVQKETPKPSSDSNTTKEQKNPKIVGIVKQINYTDSKITSLLISDNNKAEYVFTINNKVDFKDEQNLKIGDKVEIEHTGQIAESYPAQGTALRITILESLASETVGLHLYSPLPITAPYNEEIFQKSMNSFRAFFDIIQDKTRFDKYINDINFNSENKINLRSKYNESFFKDKKLILILKFTSSTPTYSIEALTKSNEKLNILLKEKTSESQTDDILIKGFLIEIDKSLIEENTAINLQYIRQVVAAADISETSIEDQIPPAERTDFSLILDDGFITLGSYITDDKLSSLLGKEEKEQVEVLSNADTFTGCFIKKISFKDLNLTLMSPKGDGRNYWLLEMQSTGPNYATAAGIKVGDNLAKLAELYPSLKVVPDGGSDKNNCAYQFNNPTSLDFIHFKIKNGSIAEIKFYRELP